MTSIRNKVITVVLSSAIFLSNIVTLPLFKGEEVKADDIPSIEYSTHIQNIGWQDAVQDGETSSTIGEKKRIEGIIINTNNENLSVIYSAHVQGYGWQDYVKAGEMAGTIGEKKRIEAISIKLGGSEAKNYDIYYRVHAEKFGWLGWAKNGENAGTKGYGYRLEAIEIKLVKKDSEFIKDNIEVYKEKTISVTYKTHVQSKGWQGYVKDGAMSGTSGEKKRLEAISISLVDPKYMGHIEYSTHVQSKGWQNYVRDGAISGTSGEGKRLEAIKIRLTGKYATEYDIYYRVHAQKFGWLGWAKNGQVAGTEGYGYRLEGIEIKIVYKGDTPPGKTDNIYYKKGVTNVANPEDIDNSIEIVDPGDEYCATIPSLNYFNLYKLNEIDLDELLGKDQEYAVKGNKIITPNEEGKGAYGVNMDKVNKNNLYYNQTLSMGLTLNMRNGQYIDFNTEGLLHNYLPLLINGDVDSREFEYLVAQNKDNYKYIDKEGRAIKDVQVCLTMDKTKFFYKTNDLSEITEVAKDTFSYYEYDPSNIDYDPDLTEEIFIVFYNSKDKCNEVTRIIIFYNIK